MVIKNRSELISLTVYAVSFLETDAAFTWLCVCPNLESIFLFAFGETAIYLKLD